MQNPLMPKDAVTISEAPAQNSSAAQFNIDSLIEDLGKLNKLLNEEKDLLKAKKFDALGDVLSAKQNLSHRLEIQSKLISRQPEIIREASADKKQALRFLEESAKRIANENVREAYKKREMNRLVVEGVSNYMREQNMQTYNQYGMANNATSSQQSKYKVAVPPVAISASDVALSYNSVV